MDHNIVKGDLPSELGLRHLVNFGKYVASLSVVVVTAIFGHDKVSTAVVATVAAVYAATWDIRMDWGLGWSDLVPASRPGAAVVGGAQYG